MAKKKASKKKKSGKQPYIPLYIGDWEQDTNTISLEAEGALLKLTFKLWKATPRGTVIFTVKQLATLFKKSADETIKILDELAHNLILNIAYNEDKSSTKIESRRMLREAAISQVRKNAVEQRKDRAPVTKGLQNPDNEIEFDNEDEVIDNTLKESWLQIQIRENYPNISKLQQQLTIEEAQKIEAANTELEILDVLDAMENKKDLTKKYLSVYRTILNWLKIRRTGTAMTVVSNGSRQQSNTPAPLHQRQQDSLDDELRRRRGA